MKKLAALIFLMLSAFHPLKAQGKPNVVFILADDLGYGDAGAYGQKLIRTPNIDQLAENGMLFTQFYAGTSVCAPSRSSLMTGQHTGHTPIRGNYEINPEGQRPLPDSTITIAKIFKKAGYTTGDFGKWGLGFAGSSGDPLNQGFDRFYGYNCQRQSHNYFPEHLWDNTQKVILANDLVKLKEYAPDLIQKEALNFIEVNKAQPFFLYLSYTLPHAGLQLPVGNEDFEQYKKTFNEQPKPIKKEWDGNGYQPQAYPHAAYAAMVTTLDTYVGQVVAKLKALGLDKNTLIVFTSDNGPHREGGNDPEFFNSSGGFKGIKRSLYEGGIREPMIVYWPGKIGQGKRTQQTGAFWDFLPTFAELIQQPVPVHTDGISILPTLLSKGKQQQHEFLYWEFHEDGGRQAIRKRKWKAVKNKADTEASKWELYNLETDPQESYDLAAQEPILIRQLEEIAHQSHRPSDVPEWNFKRN
ncbi:arylsulfatase A-like enzyme [Pedobacter cryoconitis]|uniref:arylsulfatase n=1 Tax=Pedobacter cryoconitis TaxID=188932 RepID=UPI00160DBDAE|nr:arylsulfatase [Pedobacter cryoconitis]MBB6272294.1 arylsulfatase A-like enzyme [Pedobacter cryoconitis]